MSRPQKVWLITGVSRGLDKALAGGRGGRHYRGDERADTPPLNLILGSDALARTRALQAQLAADLAAWETTTIDSDFPARPAKNAD